MALRIVTLHTARLAKVGIIISLQVLNMIFIFEFYVLAVKKVKTLL